MATRKSSKKKSTKKRPQDAIALLRADHAKVDALFKQFESARKDAVKAKLARQICLELTLHATIEEKVFYPQVRQAIGAEDLMDEADVEHQSAKDLIAQIEAGGPGQDKWDAKVIVLGEYIKHHVKEEHTEMFPKVKKSGLDLQEIGQQLATRKQQLKSELRR